VDFLFWDEMDLGSVSGLLTGVLQFCTMLKLFVFTSLLLTLFACAGDRPVAGDSEFGSGLTKNPPAEVKSVERGMKFVDFSAFCKPPGQEAALRGDHISRVESGLGTTIRWTLARTDFRERRGCVGTFTFEDGRLDSIYE
jgi:hypothetical protein